MSKKREHTRALQVMKKFFDLTLICMWTGVSMWTFPLTWTIPTTHAAVSSCSASVTPTSIGTNTTDVLRFTVNNSDNVNIRWVRFTAPSEAFEITTGSTSGWASTIESPTQIVFKFGTIAAGSSQVFSVTVQTGVTTQESAPWTVESSDTTSGASPFSCSGSASVSIAAPATPPVISNTTASSITTSGATITWTTDKSASSVVTYGKTTDYGSTSSASTLVTSHSRTLTELSSSTTYHYKVSSTDTAGNTTTSADNTFTTATPEVEATPTPIPMSTATPTPALSSVSSSDSDEQEATLLSTPTSTPAPRRPSGIAGPSPTPLPEAIADTISPSVQLSQVPTNPVAVPGTITGVATDDRGIARVQFSTDGGRNWLPVQQLVRSGDTHVTFSFTPRVTLDGNYIVVVRAFDTSGNIGVSAPVELIVDQAPPEVGTALFSIGPQLLQPDQSGALRGLPGLDYTVTVSARGGATKIDLYLGDSVHSLVQHPGTGLWSGAIHASEAGTYTILARSEDGAGNITERALGELHAVSGSQVVTENGETIAGAQVELYYFEQALNDFVLWRGPAFGQVNPQTTAQNGYFGFLPHAGTYYLSVSAPGYQSAQSTIFTLATPEPLMMNMVLKERASIDLGPFAIPLPAWRLNSVPVQIAAQEEGEAHALLNQTLPIGDRSSGERHVYTVITGWSPQASEQMAALEELRKNSSDTTVSSLVAESPPVGVRLWQERGKYEVPFTVDPTGEKQRELSVTTTPLHFILDAEGIVRNVVSGIVSAAKLEELLR